MNQNDGGGRMKCGSKKRSQASSVWCQTSREKRKMEKGTKENEMEIIKTMNMA